jgi:hypothetical protein
MVRPLSWSGLGGWLMLRVADKLLELTRPKRIELGAKRGHPPGIQAVVLVLSHSPAGDKLEGGEHAEVLRDRRPAHGEVTGQLGHRLFAVPQQLQQAAASGLRDRDNQIGHVDTLVAANAFRKAFRVRNVPGTLPA